MGENPNNRDYESAEIVVHWRPDLCTHCRACVEGLPQVFNLERRPWVDLSQASTGDVVSQVLECPSGALTFSKK